MEARLTPQEWVQLTRDMAEWDQESQKMVMWIIDNIKDYKTQCNVMLILYSKLKDEPNDQRRAILREYCKSC